MKRSTSVTLVLMGAVGVGGIAYALTPDSCRPPPSAVANDPPRDCRTSRGSSGGHGFYFGSGSSSSSTTTSSSSSSSSSSSPSSTSAPSSRGGFGAIGRAFASFSGGG